MSTNPPKFSLSAAVKVRLLQDAVYAEDAELWAALLRYRSPHVEGYFQEIGLQLVVHEEDGFAYLKQADAEESAGLPRLFRRDRLTRGVAVVGVVLRERLLQFDERVHDESRLILTGDEIIQMVAPFFPEANDTARADKRVEAAIGKAEDLGLLRKVTAGAGDGDRDARYEVRRIVKARFPVQMLTELRDQLQAHANTRDGQ